MEVTPRNNVKMGFSTTSEYVGAKVLLKAGERTIFEQRPWEEGLI